MNTVLYITYDGLSEPLGQSQVIPYLAGLSKEGYRFIIISFEKEKFFAANRNKISEILTKNNIEWIPLHYHKRPPVFSTVWDVFAGMIMIKKLCRKHKISIVHCRGYIPGLIAYRICRAKKIPFVFDMRGFWADERVEGNIWNISRPLYKMIYNYFKYLEKKFFNNADAVVTLTYASKDYVGKTFNVKNKITVVPCCVNEDIFKVCSKETRLALRKKLGLGDSFTFIYVGSLGTWYLLEEMLRFFAVVKKINTDVKFLFVTNESGDMILALAEKNKIPATDLVITNSSYDKVPDYLNAADAGIFFIMSSFSKMASSPIKHAEMLACHLPVICNDGVGDIKKITSESGTGVLVTSFSDDAFQKAYFALLDLFKSKTMNFEFALNEYYSLYKGIKNYKSIYDSLLP